MADPSPRRNGVDPVVDRVNKLDRRLGVLEGPSGTQRAQAVKQLQKQVADLVGRVSSYEATYDLESWDTTTGNAVNHPFGPVVEFDLDQRRLVRARLTAHAHVSATRPAGSTSRLEVDAVINPIWDGVRADPGSSFQSGYDEEFLRLPPGTGEAELHSYRRLVAEVYLVLDPGTHTAEAWINAKFSDTAGGTNTGGVTFSNPSVAVDVLQPVT